MKPDNASSTTQRQNGQTGPTRIGGTSSPFLALMRETGVPLTRQNYLELALGLKPGEKVPAEAEAMVPEQFRLKTI